MATAKIYVKMVFGHNHLDQLRRLRDNGRVIGIDTNPYSRLIRVFENERTVSSKYSTLQAVCISSTNVPYILVLPSDDCLGIFTGP